MTQSLWPIRWPIDISNIDPEQVDAAEAFAATTMHHLTARRVGFVPVTVMPCSHKCQQPKNMKDPFHPILLESGQMANCFCGSDCRCTAAPSVHLDGPVGAILSVMVDGVELPPEDYRVEDGHRLVRLGGKGWPSCAGDRFTVTYSNAYPVDALGRMAGGHLAAEYLKLLSEDKKCRLPASVTSMSRAGVSFEFQTGMFPGGVTGIQEVDAYLMLWNPHALKTPPTIHSIDRRRNRQVTWGGR